jgi:group I intron endonuclease
VSGIRSDGLILYRCGATATKSLILLEKKATFGWLFSLPVDETTHGRVYYVHLSFISEIVVKGQFIYKIVNTVNGKFYVGSTTNTRERFRTHRNRLRRNRHHAPHLQAAWNKYGEAAFVFHVVEDVPAGASLQAAEDVWLSEHVGKPYCYNAGLRSGAPWRGGAKEDHPSFGRPKTDSEREAISKTLKDFYAEDVTNHPRFGKTHSEETKERIRQAKLANPTTAWLGKERSEETKAKISAAQAGKPKAAGRKVSEEGRAKIRANIEAGRSHMHWAGRTHTAEAKAKMSKKVWATQPDGTRTLFESISALRDHTGLKAPTINRALKSETPLQKGAFKGWLFQYAVT